MENPAFNHKRGNLSVHGCCVKTNVLSQFASFKSHVFLLSILILFVFIISYFILTLATFWETSRGNWASTGSACRSSWPTTLSTWSKKEGPTTARSLRGTKLPFPSPSLLLLFYTKPLFSHSCLVSWCGQVQGLLWARLQDPVSERDSVCQPLRHDEGSRTARALLLQGYPVSQGTVCFRMRRMTMTMMTWIYEKLSHSLGYYWQLIVNCLVRRQSWMTQTWI